MHLKQILEKIKQFNVTDDNETSDFFDKYGDKIVELDLESTEKALVIQELFNFLNRQSSESSENWSFIHLIEYIDKPTYKIYNKELIHFNNNTPSSTSVLLLNRHINSLQGEARENAVNLLKEISERQGLSGVVRENAKDFFDYQLSQ